MYKLILVDDEPWAIEGLEQIISWESYGFEVCGRCSSARQALRKILEKKPDAVCTDIRMPDLSGMDLISQVRMQKGLDVEFVIISAYSNFEAARKAIQFGAVGYILKPLSAEEVSETAKRLKQRLDQKHASKALSVDPRNPVQMKQTAALLPQPGPNCGCVVLISEKDGVPRDWQTTALHIAGERRAAWFCILPSQEAPNAPPFSGCSLPRSSSAELADMVREALLSFRGGFQFSRHPVVAGIQLYLGEHYKDALSLSQLASQFYLAENYLCDLFKKNTGETIFNFLKKLRLSIACQLLRDTNMSVKEIAGTVGFNDFSYFGRVFRQSISQTPEQYRLSHSSSKYITENQ